MAGLRPLAETIDSRGESDRMNVFLIKRFMPLPKRSISTSKTVSVPIKEYERLKTIEKEFQKGYDVVPILFPSEDISDYAYGSRVKKSLAKAMKKYPPSVWK